MTIESKLIDRFISKIEAQDVMAAETMSGGSLSSFEEYVRLDARRKALADAKVLILESLDDVMKE